MYQGAPGTWDTYAINQACTQFGMLGTSPIKQSCIAKFIATKDMSLNSGWRIVCYGTLCRLATLTFPAAVQPHMLSRHIVDAGDSLDA